MGNQHFKIRPLAAGLLLCGMLVLAGCGGGGSDTAAVVAPTSFTLAGTAAGGAPFVGATVTVIDSTGATYPAAGGAAVTTGADGSYTITLPLSAKPPFVIRADRDDRTLVSVATDTKDSTVNITPITNLIASRLSASGDPTKLANEVKSGTTTIDATKVAAKVTEVVNLIAPVTSAVGDKTDPLNGKFVADGTGQDKVLDSLSINITPSSATTVNIEVAAKAKTADGSSPAVVQFTNTTAPPAALPAVAAADLVPDGTTPLIADLLKRMNACLALPLSSRVNAGGKTAADIIAPECKTLFSGDDPTKFKNSGVLVGANGAFSGIFSADGNGVVFDRGNYEFTRMNGDIVFSFRDTDTSGNVEYSAVVATAEGTPAKLKLIGNQYKYPGGVNAYQQLREFINQPAATYYSTGYNLQVANWIGTNGSPLFDRVEVTTPKGNVITLRPTKGNSLLDLMQNGKLLAGTSVVRLRSVYADPTNTADPAKSSDANGLFFASPSFSEGDVSSIPAQSVWTFNYFLAGNTGTTPDATQPYKTFSRAMTIGEIQAKTFANLTDADIANAKANTKTNPANANSGWYNAPATGPFTFDWVVPTGALAPQQIKVWGGVPVTTSGVTTQVSFDDQAGVSPSSRTGNISCSKATAADAHCDANGNYAAGAWINAMHLWASDSRIRQFAHLYAIYKITM